MAAGVCLAGEDAGVDALEAARIAMRPRVRMRRSERAGVHLDIMRRHNMAVCGARGVAAPNR